MANLLTVWRSLKKQADAADAEVLERIARAYASGYVRVDANVRALTEQLDAMQKTGKLTAAAVKKSATFTALIVAITDELDAYEGYLRTEMAVAAEEAAKRGLSHENVLLLAGVAMALGVAVQDVPTDALANPGDDALYFLSQYLDTNGELFRRINALSGYHADLIAQGILERVSEGLNPRDVAKWITDAYGVGLTDSMRMMRTTQLYSYRQANRAAAMANSDVIQGMVWCAELDGDTCMSCVAMHGQVLPVDAICDDHHNGRCVLLPWVKGMDNPIDKTGEDWFNEQSEATQREMMGAGKFEAWQEGKYNFDQLSRTYEDDIFGTMRGETPLNQLLGDNDG